MSLSTKNGMDRRPNIISKILTCAAHKKKIDIRLYVPLIQPVFITSNLLTLELNYLKKEKKASPHWRFDYLILVLIEWCLHACYCYCSLVCTRAIFQRYYYDPHFRDEAIEAVRIGHISCQEEIWTQAAFSSMTLSSPLLE